MTIEELAQLVKDMTDAATTMRLSGRNHDFRAFVNISTQLDRVVREILELKEESNG